MGWYGWCWGSTAGITQGCSRSCILSIYGAREKGGDPKCAVAKSYIMTALLSVVVLAVSRRYSLSCSFIFDRHSDNVIDLTMLYLRPDLLQESRS